MLNEFKEFVKKNPGLIKYVKNGEMSWQKFYEMYDLYGESDDAWGPYLKKEEPIQLKAKNTTTFSDVLTWLKAADLTALEEGINSVQRVIGVLQELGTKETPKQEYKPRPLYKHFED